MTDRELLELAAKAVNFEFLYMPPTKDSSQGEFLLVRNLGKRWNPLTDDGDALRLMAKLRLDVCRPYRQHAEVCVWVDHLRDFFEEPEGDDPAAATRRAIVRAAAEIGKATP